MDSIAQGEIRRFERKFCSHFLVQVSLRVCVCFSTTMMMMMMTTTTTLACVVLRLRIANRLVEGSYCRGGIVNTRGVRSRTLLERRSCPKALWRFRASTSNSPSGRSWPPTDTALRHIYHTYARQDIRICGVDHF